LRRDDRRRAGFHVADERAALRLLARTKAAGKRLLHFLGADFLVHDVLAHGRYLTCP